MSYNAENENAWRHTFTDNKHEVKVKYADTEGEMKLSSTDNGYLYNDNLAIRTHKFNKEIYRNV